MGGFNALLKLIHVECQISSECTPHIAQGFDWLLLDGVISFNVFCCYIYQNFSLNQSLLIENF